MVFASGTTGVLRLHLEHRCLCTWNGWTESGEGMKKLLFLLTIMVCILAFGVIDKRVSANNQHPTYNKFHLPSVVWVDPETGVQYIVIDEFGLNGGIGITPRLDTNGKPMVEMVK